MRPHRSARDRLVPILLCYSILLTAGTSLADAPLAAQSEPPADSYVLVWLFDRDFADSDFLAVIDADPESPSYAKVVQTLPVGSRGATAHHTNYLLPANGRLFANGYYSGQTWVIDARRPLEPSVVGSFGLTPEPYLRLPHSFAALENGHTLAAFQDGAFPDPETGEGADGGLVELDESGRVLRVASAADPVVEGPVHPYSLDALPAIDRVITGTADIMRDGAPTRSVQIWSLSEFKLLQTIQLEHGPRGVEATNPVEPRALSDGRSAMVVTDDCGLYYIRGLEQDEPAATLVHDFGVRPCAVPVLIGRFWIQTVAGERAIVVLDVSDPSRPVEVDRLTFPGDRDGPHWISASPDGRRLLLSAGGGIAFGRVTLMHFDPETGAVTLDESFRDEGSPEVGVSTLRESWPHGNTGPAVSHGAVFWDREVHGR
jgi:hypothetical protein